MSIRDTSLDQKIIESAKKQFLEKGFLQTSLKDICKDAGVTTGAVYKRYNGKEDLFAEVVKPAIKIFENLDNETLNTYIQSEANNSLIESFDNTIDRTKHWIKELFKEKTALKILLCKSDGTVYSDFIQTLIENNAKDSYKFMKDLERKKICTVKMTKKEYHAIVTGYWTSVFEIFIHNFSLKEAMTFSEKLNTCYTWENFMEL